MWLEIGFGLFNDFYSILVCLDFIHILIVLEISLLQLYDMLCISFLLNLLVP